jgi:hypothetical protein
LRSGQKRKKRGLAALDKVRSLGYPVCGIDDV